jgi:hypothetical protein
MTTLEGAPGPDGDLLVHNSGTTLALGVEPEDLPEDGHGVPAVALTGPLHLLPGETGTVRLAWMGLGPAQRACQVRAWNSEPVAVRWPA